MKFCTGVTNYLQERNELHENRPYGSPAVPRNLNELLSEVYIFLSRVQ